ncbi:MAG: hypothetical protein NTU98_01215 [Bacteroidetes bacterium]|nr:hypothetical protein [Bacteroidota bacterium]
MRKVVLFLLGFFFLLNSISLYFILEVHRHRISSMIEKHAIKKGVEVLSVDRKDLSALVIRKDKKEISCQGRLYDVISEVQEKDHVDFYCIRDTKEEDIISGMHKTGSNKLVSLLLNDFVKFHSPETENQLLLPPSFVIEYPALKDMIDSYNPSLITPPPERS